MSGVLNLTNVFQLVINRFALWLVYEVESFPEVELSEALYGFQGLIVRKIAEQV